MKSVSDDIEHQKKRAAFRQAALAAGREYQDGSRHLTRKKVDAWLKQFAVGAAAELPECHRIR